MTKMQIAICDDEREIRELLRDKVRKAYPEAEIYAYETGENFLAAGRHPDILFLDIQMQGRDGMEWKPPGNFGKTIKELFSFL